MLVNIDALQAQLGFWIYSIQYYKYESHNFFSFYILFSNEIIIWYA